MDPPLDIYIYIYIYVYRRDVNQSMFSGKCGNDARAFRMLFASILGVAICQCVTRIQGNLGSVKGSDGRFSNQSWLTTGQHYS